MKSLPKMVDGRTPEQLIEDGDDRWPDGTPYSPPMKKAVGTLFDPAVQRSAAISPCGLYRYQLRRVWDDSLRSAAFIMLNPSIADAEQDDPTIRRCIAFARRWGCGGIEVVNLFAFRATDPRELIRGTNVDRAGPANDLYIRRAAEQCSPIVAAWGTRGELHRRDRAVLTILRAVGVPVVCLGVTNGGHPRHPLYVKGDAELHAFAAVSPGHA